MHAVIFLSNTHHFQTDLMNRWETKQELPLKVSNLLSFLLRCGTRPYGWGTQWELNSLIKVCLSTLLTTTPPEVPLFLQHLRCPFFTPTEVPPFLQHLRCPFFYTIWGAPFFYNTWGAPFLHHLRTTTSGYDSFHIL